MRMNRCCLCKRPPEAWIAPREIRELREISRYGHKLVSQVHAVLAKLGTPVTRELLIFVFYGMRDHQIRCLARLALDTGPLFQG